jgi:hypothetical protein
MHGNTIFVVDLRKLFTYIYIVKIVAKLSAARMPWIGASLDGALFAVAQDLEQPAI